LLRSLSAAAQRVFSKSCVMNCQKINQLLL
jgi:hypothetical protein